MKKGQQTGSQAAIVIGILTLLIIFYIMFLPQEDRDALLGPSGGTGSPVGKPPAVVTPDYPTGIVFSQNIGLLKSQDFSSYEYDLSATNIYYSENTQVIARVGNIFVKNSWFDKVDREFYFDLPQGMIAEDMSLVVTLGSFKGSLIINLNGKELYNYPVRTPNLEPIAISISDLKDSRNIIRFSVSDVGVSFWTRNEIEIEDAKVIARISDPSRRESQNIFHIDQDHASQIESATISFSPDCKTQDAGILSILLNDRQVFRGIPDCGTINRHRIDPSMLYSGKNTLYFSTDKGSYLIDRISVKTSLKKPDEPTYYFDIHEEMFIKSEKDVYRCGEVDGVCPPGCDEDLDRDCCFQRYVKGYWCDVKTGYLDDRCVGFVDENRCDRCPSGYEDRNGHPSDACKGLCGDDKDGKCPAGCSPNYDKDCCFQREGEQYWCDDLPITGEDYICVDELTYDSCRFCPTGYKGEKTSPRCESDKDKMAETILKPGIEIILRLDFTESGRQKEAELYLNGHKTGFSTRLGHHEMDIGIFIEPGTNSIMILPKTDLDIRKLTVRVEE